MNEEQKYIELWQKATERMVDHSVAFDQDFEVLFNSIYPDEKDLTL